LEGRTYHDWVKAAGKADRLHEAVRIAELGADRFDGAQEHALNAVAHARADGFRVAEDLSVIDTRMGGSREERAARQVLAQEHVAYIRHCAAGLVAVDREISANLLAATDGLGAVSFDETPISGIDDTPSHGTERNGVQAVGYGQWPEAPSPGDPVPPHQPTKTAEDVRKALNLLPDGKNEPVKTLPTPEEIRKTFEDLTQNAPEAPPTKKPYKGTRRILDDGTKIGMREDSKSGGPAVDVTYPDGTKQKVHLPKPIKGANPPVAPQTPSVISAPPTLPPELNHPPVAAVPPPVADHPPTAVPPVVVDHPPVDAPPAPITLPRLPDPPPEAITQVESGLAAVGAAIVAGLGWLAHPHL
jgi:hypothetical protein